MVTAVVGVVSLAFSYFSTQSRDNSFAQQYYLLQSKYLLEQRKKLNDYLNRIEIVFVIKFLAMPIIAVILIHNLIIKMKK